MAGGGISVEIWAETTNFMHETFYFSFKNSMQCKIIAKFLEGI